MTLDALITHYKKVLKKEDPDSLTYIVISGMLELALAVKEEIRNDYF